MSKLVARVFSIMFVLASIPCLALEIPKSLEEWKPWVLEKHPDINCPILFNNANRSCSWYSTLNIEASDTGAQFTQTVEVYKSDWITLPGNAAVWPHTLTDNQRPISARDRNGIPEIYLQAGPHQLGGKLSWQEMPRALTLPNQTGIVHLTLKGTTVNNPVREDNNQLWLINSEPNNTATHQDALSVRVFRKIEDTIPFNLTTQVQLDVSGKERELQLGQLLLNGFVTTEFTSALPARIEKDGSLRIRVKPGSWILTLIAQSTAPIKNLTYKATSDVWPQQEIWVFAAERKLRSVQISGAQTIDPQQTQLPEEWKSLPAYLVTPQTRFTLEELYRGENKEFSGELNITRNAWLSFDGKRFIFNDNINGETRSSRLDTIEPVMLTSATINGEPQLITHLDKNQNSGIEIRFRNIVVSTVSQINRSLSIPVTGWNHEFNSLHTELFLPPGWSLLTATGASTENGSWFSAWTLWDMFAVLIIMVACVRITSPLAGLLAGVTLVIIYQRLGAPVFIWLNLIAVLALTKLASGKFKIWIVRYGYISFLSLVLITLPFAVREARLLFNPSLEDEHFWVVSSSALMQTSDKNRRMYKEAPVFAPAPPAASAAAPMAMSEQMDSVNPEDIGQFPDRVSATSLQRLSGIKLERKFEQKYDPSQQTQTGVAVPNHRQNPINLTWDGPIKSDETTFLVLIPPALNKLGNLLAIFLPLLLAGIFLRAFLQATGKQLPRLTLQGSATASSAACILIASLSLYTPDTAQADITVDAALLKELETRLTEPPKCLPHCAAIERVKITLKQDQLTLDMAVNASDLIALPLPVNRQQWWPNQVSVDGKPATLVQGSNQNLLVSLPGGLHNLSISANLQGQDTVNLQFPVALHNVSTATSGWDVSGLPTPEQTSQSLQLQRVARDQDTAKAEHLRLDPIAAFVTVKRTIRLDLNWTVNTVVSRVAPVQGAINLEVPLLSGESPLTTKANANGKIPVRLEANDYEYEWSSNFREASPIKLQAAQNVPWVEIWALEVSPLWHSETTGIAPVQMEKHENIPLWQPWPGETLTIDVHRPQATQGNHLTIDEVWLNHRPGNNNSLSELNLTLRSNQGGQYTFKLPEGAQLSKLFIDDSEQLISATKGVLKLPLRPGSQKILIGWKQDTSVGLLTRTPGFTLENGSSNQNINLELSGNRWVLWLGGPQVGPSVLLWGMLLVVGLMAYCLGHTKLTPLKSYEWVLLSLGICTLSLWSFVIVTLWLLALSQRGRLQQVSKQWHFKLLQLGLFAFSVIALMTLVTTLPNGLLGSPEMHIIGRNTYGNSFYWYQDYSEAAYPVAWVISLPLWTYKFIILLWSLWLAASLMKWLRWGWQQLSYQGIWYASDKILVKPPASTIATETPQEK